MSDTNTSNGTEAKKTALDKLHEEWIAAGKPKADAKTAKALMAAHSAARKAKLAAEKALEAAMADEMKASIAIIKVKGKGRFQGPDGTQYTPMSKGESVFLRVDNQADLDTFGG